MPKSILHPQLSLASLAISFSAVILSPAALADNSSQKIVQSLASTCANCHGTAGKAIGTRLPRLAGQSEADLLASLKGYKDGSRPGTVMPQLAKGYTDQQLAQLAAYFAAQKN